MLDTADIYDYDELIEAQLHEAARDIVLGYN